MNSILAQLALLGVVCVAMAAAAGGNVEMKPLSATKPRRYQLGSLIKSDEGDGVLLEHSGDAVKYQLSEKETGTMLAKVVSIGIDPLQYRRTMVTLPVPSDMKQGSDYSKLIGNAYCVNIRFLAIEDLPNKEKLPEDSLIIISNDLKASILNEEVCKNLKERKCKLGFLKKLLPLEDRCRHTLIECQVSFIENLELPDDFDLMAAVKSGDKHYYGYKMMFVPFKNATMLYSDEKVEQRALVNLADMIMFEGDDRMVQFCKEKRSDIVDFSHKLVSDSFPVLPDVELPRFINRDDHKKNESISSDKKNATSGADHWLRFSGRSGTHLVAPYRYDKSNSNVGNLQDAFFFSPCAVISSPYGDTANFTVTKGHLEQWEKDNGRQIAANSAIFVNTGYGSKWSKLPEKYIVEYPGIDVDALKWLVEERKVVAVGIDSPSLDAYSLTCDNNWPGHGYLAKKNIPAILNLNFERAEKFPSEGSRCVYSYLRIDRGTSSPISVFGLPGYEKMELGGGSGEKSGVKSESNLKQQGELTKSSSPFSKRWQLGHVIKAKSDDCGDCSLRKVDMSLYGAGSGAEAHKMVFTEIGLSVDPSINRVTTYTQPGDMPNLSMKGCVETLFIKTTELMSIKQKLKEVVHEETAVIFMTTDLMKLHDEGLMKEAADKKVCLGFFNDVELPSDVRNILLKYKLSFFENLVRPDGFNDADIDENKIYYGFKFIFTPFDKGTSLGESVDMEPSRKVNLAELVIYDAGERDVVDRCSRKNWITLSHNWSPVDKVPVTPNMTRPQLVDNGKRMIFYDHFGTHIDSPAHLNPSNRADIAHLPDTLDRPVCLRIDIPYDGKANFAITRQHFVDWETNSGVKIPSKCLAMLVTGFGAKNWDNVDDYQKDFPGLALDGAKFLVEERGVIGIGIDSLTIDVFSVASTTGFPVHEYLSSKNVIIIENIGGDQIGKMTYDGSAQCVLSYLRFDGATGGPVAVYGLLADTPKEIKLVSGVRPKVEVEPKETTTKKADASANQATGHLLIGSAVLCALFRGRF